MIFSNIGGSATAIGDPPNVLIASDPDVIAGGVNFFNFTLHMSLCAVLVALASMALLRLMYGRLEADGGGGADDQIGGLRRELHIWHRTAQVRARI